MDESKVLSIIPAHVPAWAVFVAEAIGDESADSTIEVYPIHAWALVELTHQEGTDDESVDRTVVGLVTWGQSVDLVNETEMYFLGYSETASPNPVDFADEIRHLRDRERRERQERKKAKQS